MARWKVPNNSFELLCDELHEASVAKGYAAKSKPLAKSVGPLEAFCAKAQAAGGKVTIREKANLGDPIHVKGKEARNAKPKADQGENAEPPEHPGLRVAKAINEMRAHAIGKSINSAVKPEQLEACKLLARTGRLDPSEVDDVEAALNDGRALPSHILRKLGSGNA